MSNTVVLVVWVQSPVECAGEQLTAAAAEESFLF